MLPRCFAEPSGSRSAVRPHPASPQLIPAPAGGKLREEIAAVPPSSNTTAADSALRPLAGPLPPPLPKPQPHLSPGDLGLTGLPPPPTSSPSPPMRCDAFSQWECPLNGSCFSLLPCQLLLRCDGTSMTFSPLGPWGPDLWSQTNVH